MVKISESLSQKLKNANVLFTILIVWLHVHTNYDLPDWVSGMSIFSVPCFFAISSFLYFKSYDFNQPWDDYKKKVITRFKSLLIPFLIFNIVGFIFNFISYRLNPGISNPFDTLLNSDFLEYIVKSRPNGPLWYFLCLFSFILVAPLLGFTIKASKWSLLLIIPIYWICQNISYFYFPYWMVDIFIGAYIAIQGIEIPNYKDNKLKMGGVIMSVSIILLGAYGAIDAYTTRALAPICFMIIYSQYNILPSKLVTLLAPYSILIYCLHIPISRIAVRIPMILHISYPFLALIISAAATILIIVVIGKVLKTSPIIWSILSGGR